MAKSKKIAGMFGPVCAKFELDSEEHQGGTCQTVEVRLVDCDYTGFPAARHDMVRMGAPEWLTHASTSWNDVVVGKGRSKKIIRRFANDYLGRI